MLILYVDLSNSLLNTLGYLDVPFRFYFLVEKRVNRMTFLILCLHLNA